MAGAGAAIGAIACASDPVCVSVVLVGGSVLTIYVAYKYVPSLVKALENAEQDIRVKTWPPCVPPVGTIGYREDSVPPSKPHHPFPGNHVHLYRMNQNPNNGQCFWQPIGVTAPPPPPRAVPIGPAMGGVPF